MNSANVQFAAIILGILAGIFLSNRAVERLEDRMNSRFNALDARMDRIFSEFGTFPSIQG